MTPLHLRSMLSKLMRCTENCMPAAGTGQQKEPNSLWQRLAARHTTNISKAEWIRLQSLTSSAIFTWPLTNWLPLLQESWQLFAWKCSTSSRMQNNFPRVHWILKHGFLCYRNKQTYLLVAKVYWWMVPILINQCIFAPSYTDLKFTVWNCNYFLH